MLKVLGNLFVADVKMLFRNKQSLIWALVFPLVFTAIFGFFFGNGSSQTGEIALINYSKQEIAQTLETNLAESDFIKVTTDYDLAEAKDKIDKGQISALVEIPKSFGQLDPDSDKDIKILYDPANIQSVSVAIGFINSYITQLNFKVNQVQPIFGIQEEKTNNRDLDYFDFVIIGLIGMALMNSSIQGIAISISKYREDKILKRLNTTPMPNWAFVVAEVLSRLIINFIQVTLILAIAIYGFGAHIYGSIFLIYLLSMLGAVLFQSIGFGVASVARTTDAAQGMSMAVSIPMMFLAGVFFPIGQLPSWLSSIANFLPLAPLLKMLRQSALEEISAWSDPWNMVIVMGWIIIMLIISIRFFKLKEE